MRTIFETSDNDIKGLNALELTRLLGRLLSIEAETNGIQRSAITASLDITVSDGGEDASIEWQGAPDYTEWIPNRNTLFQCKATSTGPKACAKEILTKDESAVKPRVDEVLSSGGAYVLFCNTSCNKKMAKARITAIRDALRQKGKIYSDTAEIRIYGANKISLWANSHVSAILAVRLAVGGQLPASAKTWKEWSDYNEYKRDFVSDTDLNNKIESLRKLLTSGPNSVARIVGLSGIGKSRLAFEVFRPPDNSKNEPNRHALNESCVYIDAEKTEGNEIVACVEAWVRERLYGTIIVDNCERPLHQTLYREVRHADSRLRLVTLDYNMDEEPHTHPLIVLEPVSDEIITGILKQAYPAMSKTDVSRIVNFAQGFPRMAVLIADAHLEHVQDIANLKDQELIERLIWQRSNPDPAARKVIEACSLFKHLGYDDDVTEQRVYVAENICQMDKNEFYKHTENFIRHRIIDRRNRYIRVVPIPLAITLAAKWWRDCSPELARDLFLSQMPEGLAESLCDQLSNLHFVPRAKEIVSELCGNNGPFGQAEVLLSEQGSRLFRSLVEVIAEPCLHALTQAIGSMNREQLLKVGPARRNLVWALEKLCFWENTFEGAARLMLAFATAENETWANNATNQFLQLFHLHLSGTQAAPRKRLKLIDEALDSNCDETRRLGVRAMESALEMHHFSRTGGVERQGTRPSAEDWTPKTWPEVFEYQDACINRLTQIATGPNKDLSELAASSIGRSLRGLIQRSRRETLDNALRTIATSRKGYWPEALHSLRHSIEYDGTEMPEDLRKQIETWVELLQPSGIEERLRLLITNPDYEHREVDGPERFIDVSAERATNLAHELAHKLGELKPHLVMLSQGEQRQAYNFGKALANAVDDPRAFANCALSALRQVDIDTGNPSLLCGFLAGQKERDTINTVLETAANDERLIHYLVELTRLSTPTTEDLARVIQAAQIGDIPVSKLYAFAYNSVTDHFAPNDVMYFCDQIASIDVSGTVCAFEILFMYCFKNKGRAEQCRPAFRKFLCVPGFLSEVGKNPTSRGHSWESISLSLLQPTVGDDDLAEAISLDITRALSDEDFGYSAEHYVAKVLEVLLEHHFASAWPHIAEALLSDDWHVHHHMTNIMAGDWNKTKSGSLLEKVSVNELLSWAESNRPQGPIAIAPCLPVMKNIEEGSSVTWHPLARDFIDHFGSDQEFLDGISANLHTFSWSGSVIPYYEMQVSLFSELTSHKLRPVRKWAEDNLGWLKLRISRERKIEEERDIGIY